MDTNYKEDNELIKIANQSAIPPDPPHNSEIILLALKNELLKLMGYNPKNEKVEDFLFRKYQDLEKENIRLKNQLVLKTKNLYPV